MSKMTDQHTNGLGLPAGLRDQTQSQPVLGGGPVDSDAGEARKLQAGTNLAHSLNASSIEADVDALQTTLPTNTQGHNQTVIHEPSQLSMQASLLAHDESLP